MNFLGRKMNGSCQGEVVSDLSSLACRRVAEPGTRCCLVRNLRALPAAWRNAGGSQSQVSCLSLDLRRG
jgi:hypothetical protein